jgi:hypothetical protein
MNRVRIIALSLALLCALLVAGAVLATPQAFDLPWWTVDGGGGTSAGGAYSLSGTIGQPDAGLMSGGDYTLGGGFWGGGELQAAQSFVYLPITTR